MARRATIVVALFDLGRGAISGRSIDSYIEWARRTLALAAADVHLVLHDALEARLPELLEERQRTPVTSGFATHVHVWPLERIPLWRDVPRVEDILRRAQDEFAAAPLPQPRTRSNWLHQAAAFEYRCAKYAPLIHSKPAIVCAAMEDDVLHGRPLADVYVWLDAGISRLVDRGIQTTAVRQRIVERALREDAVLVARRNDLPSYYALPPRDILHGGYGGGGVFGGALLGPPAKWQKFREETEATWRRLLANDRVVSEETTWSVLIASGSAAGYLHDVGGFEEGTCATAEFPFALELLEVTERRGAP
jgi:hypothetical protein